MARKKARGRRKGKATPLESVAHRFGGLKFPLMLIVPPLALRLLSLLGMSDSPLFLYPAIDSQAYNEMAIRIAAGDIIGNTAFWQAPLYPYFLALIYAIFGIKVLAAQLLQLLLGAVNCYLIFRLAERVISRRVAWLAYIVAAIYGPFVFFESQLLAPVLLNFLVLSSLLLLTHSPQSRSAIRSLFAGVLLGVAQIGHGLVIFFLPPVLAWLVLVKRRQPRRQGAGTRAAVYLLAGFLVVVLTVTVRNYAVDQELVLVSSNFGANFYLGNHPNYDSTTAIRPGLEWDEFIQEAVVAGQTSPAERSSYFAEKAWSNILGDPLRFAGLLLKKLHLLAAGEEIKRNLDIYHFSRDSYLLRVLIWRAGIAFPSGLVLPFALAAVLYLPSVWRRQERREGAWLLWLFLLSQAVAILLFFVSTRYRLIMLPSAIILAAAVFWDLSDRVRAGRPGRILPPALLVIILLVYCNLPRLHPTAKDSAENLFYEALALTEIEGCSAAIPRYEKALELAPDYAMAKYNLANCYLRAGRDSLATAALDEIVAGNPESFVASLIVGRAYLDRGDAARAEQLFRDVLQKNPNSAEARLNLGQLYRLRRDTTMALHHLRQALAVDPKSYKAYNVIGAVYLDQGLLSQATANFQRSRDLNPSYASALNNLATVAARFNRLDEAERHLEQAIDIAPDDVSVMLNYAALLLRKNQPREALEWLDRAVAKAPQMPETHHYRGIALLSLRRTQEAIEEFQTALEINPQFAPARQELQKFGL